MTITPDQASELLDGATPGPWTASECTGFIAAAEGERTVLAADRVDWCCEADLDLAAAAPDLAQTVIDQAKRIEELEAQLAGMQWEYGVEQATGTTQWFRSRPMAEAHAQVHGCFRLVRRLVGPTEPTTQETPND